MAKRNIYKNRGKTYIFSHRGGGGQSGITVTPLTVTENGVYTSAEDQAYSPVTVRVEGDVEVEDNKPVSISENGTVVINPTSGKDAMAKVTATVNVPSGGVNTLFAWVSSGYYVYTTTANPTTQDEAYVLDSEGTNIYTEEITEVGEGTITIEKYGTSTYEYERAPDADITLQAGEGSKQLYIYHYEQGSDSLLCEASSFENITVGMKGVMSDAGSEYMTGVTCTEKTDESATFSNDNYSITIASSDIPTSLSSILD